MNPSTSRTNQRKPRLRMASPNDATIANVAAKSQVVTLYVLDMPWSAKNLGLETVAGQPTHFLPVFANEPDAIAMQNQLLEVGKSAEIKIARYVR